MPRPPTHYQVLGLTRDASSVDIADAFREKLAALKKQPHGGSVEEVQAAREAYQVLANPMLRASYDAELPSDKPRGGARGAASNEPGPIQVMMDVLRESGMIKFIVPVLVLIAIAVVYKVRQPKQEYSQPQIVELSRTVIQEAAKKEAEEEAAAPAQGAAPAGEASATPATGGGAPAMTAEELFANASPSIARIQVSDASGKMYGQGSGVVIGNGIVITNCHVVADAWQISVKVGDKVLPGVVVVADKQYDLCSLRVAGLSAPAVTVGGEVRVGQRVYAIGAPQGLELTLSEGLVSALRPTTNGAIIQTSAAISPGSSGGGLFNANGQLVGIVTFQSRTGQNLNFALPVHWISEMKPREASENVAAPVARSASSPQ